MGQSVCRLRQRAARWPRALVRSCSQLIDARVSGARGLPMLRRFILLWTPIRISLLTAILGFASPNVPEAAAEYCHNSPNRPVIGLADVFWGNPPYPYPDPTLGPTDTVRLSLEGTFPGDESPERPDCEGAVARFEIFVDPYPPLQVVATVVGALLPGSQIQSGPLGTWQWYVDWPINNMLPDGRYRFRLVALDGAPINGLPSLNVLTMVGAGTPPPHIPTVIRVPEDQLTIQSAINVAVDGDTIDVAPGTYLLPQSTTIGSFNYSVVLNKAVTLKARLLYQSILDGMGDNTVLILVTAAAQVEGFVLQNAAKGIQQRNSLDVLWSARNLILRDIGSSAIEVNASIGRVGTAWITNVVIDRCGDGFNTNDASGMIVQNVIVTRCTSAFVGFNHNFFNVSYSLVFGNTNVVGGSSPISLGPGVVQGDPQMADVTLNGLSLPYVPLCVSPLVDAGDPRSSFNDVALPPSLGTVRSDIGAYGGPGAFLALGAAQQLSFLQQVGCATAAPTITAITPTSGQTLGGTQVTITGTGFADGATVMFDGASGAVLDLQPTAIIALTPPHAVGPVDVVVTNPDGQSSPPFASFTYFVPCSYTIEPTSQSFPAAGGIASITVTSPSGCDWTSFSSVAWIEIIDGSIGSGNGTVSYKVAANTTFNPRTGTIIAAGQTLALDQARGVTLHYFALGDSVASGHGLMDDGDPCHRSDSAYPRMLAGRLAYRYAEVRFTTFACSGATAILPDTLDDPNKWFTNQVDNVLAVLPGPDEPVLVSITIGANDLRFSHPRQFFNLLYRPNPKAFEQFLYNTVEKVRQALVSEIPRLLAFPNVAIAITEYYNPLNTDSLFFSGPGGWCGLVIECYDRSELEIHVLNGAIIQAYFDMGRPARLQVSAIHEQFHGHEGPMPWCGRDPPTVGDSWIQIADCIHPNVLGSAVYAEQVDLDTLRLDR